MKNSSAKFNKTLLMYAEIFFKFALAVNLTRPRLKYLTKFWWGNYTAKKNELKLTKKQEILAPVILEHVATYILAVQIDTVLQNQFENRFKHQNSDIQSAAWIARLLRNAFSHNPFHPIWQTYNECKNKTFRVKNIIELNTAGLEGMPINRKHFGGPLAILRLSRFIRNLIV